MTDDAHAEIAALRRRLGQLEGMLEQKGRPMYSDDNDSTPQQVQQRLRAEAWRHDAEMETVQRWLERDRDDRRVTPGMRISAALYAEGKRAARAEGRDTSGRAPGRLDTTGGNE